ncbi:MAG: zinc-regulated TonB-dependent outer membrane receptor, partial [Myxococcaceae bacterium]
SLNPDLSFILDVALAGFSQDEPLQSGGHDPTKNGFNLQQLELSIGAAVDPYLRFDSNVVFSQLGVEIEEAYGTTLTLPYGLQARAGQFLTRFGRLNNTHPHAWDFIDQPFAVGKVFGGEGNRGLGLEASWLTPLPWYVEVLGSATDATGEATARSFFGATDLGVRSPLDLQLTGAVKQFFALSDPLSLAAGVSYANGPNPTGHRNRSEVYGADLYLKYRPLEGGDPTIVALQAEVFYRRRQVPGEVLADVQGYGYLFWRFDLRWATAVRYEYGSAAYGRDGRPGADPLDPEWSSDRHRVSANATFWPTEFSRLRLQGSADFATFRDAPTYAAFLAFELVVGAHGAHRF